MKRRCVWNGYKQNELSELEEISFIYRNFIDHSKTERECVKTVIGMARDNGYISLIEAKQQARGLKAGDKVYVNYMDKAVVLFLIGEKPVSEGMNILGAHIDSPRIDIKPNPLFDDEGYAYLDTHYYGGIKKYQWLAEPLALHGVIIKKDGTRSDMEIGEAENSPVLTITDILPHLGVKQAEKTVKDMVDGEKHLNLLVGNRPGDSDEGDQEQSVKRRILELLEREYGMEEEDFLSAELELVPAGKAKECGLDKSMILAYGQDDRVCVFSSVWAMLKKENVNRTACCLLVDKEEIGSVGPGGMTTRFFENAAAAILELTEPYSERKLRVMLSQSYLLSSDVSAGYDPMYDDCFEKKNASFLSKGMVLSKYTGSKGKSGSNDANPEYMAALRRLMDDNHIGWQTAEIGAVDVGGGGTIAYLMAAYGMEVIDCGIPVLSMHSLWEVSSKADIYEAVKGYKTFLDFNGMISLQERKGLR